MFKIWKDLHKSLNPAGMLADAAEAIPNGAREAFGTITRRMMCSPHVQLVCFMDVDVVSIGVVNIVGEFALTMLFFLHPYFIRVLFNV